MKNASLQFCLCKSTCRIYAFEISYADFAGILCIIPAFCEVLQAFFCFKIHKCSHPMQIFVKSIQKSRQKYRTVFLPAIFSCKSAIPEISVPNSKKAAQRAAFCYLLLRDLPLSAYIGLPAMRLSDSCMNFLSLSSKLSPPSACALLRCGADFLGFGAG